MLPRFSGGLCSHDQPESHWAENLGLASLPAYRITICRQPVIRLDQVLHPTWHKTGHLGDVPQANPLAGMEKLNLTKQKHTFTNQKKCIITQNKHKNLKPG